MTLPVHFWKPTIAASGSNVTYQPKGAYVGDFSTRGTIQFVEQANGGYWSLSLALAEAQIDVENWFEDGLGRHVEVCDDALVPVWEGFVNGLQVKLGSLTLSRGPLMGIANRVSVVYSPLDAGLDLPAAGATTTTTIADDEESKLKYGIFERVLSGGRQSDDNAEYARDSYLAEQCRPETGKDLGDPSAPAVKLDCLGYVHFLKNYVYNQAAVTGTVRIMEATGNPKLPAVLDADPNGLFSSSNASLEENLTLVNAVEDQDNTGWAVAMGMVSLGDASGNRYLLGVGKDRHVTYGAMPTEREYEQALADPAQRITTRRKTPVAPWGVRAGEWLLFTDFLMGRATPTDLREDPRALFIESAQYAAPYGSRLTGAKVGTLKQIMARLGMGGMG